MTQVANLGSQGQSPSLVQLGTRVFLVAGGLFLLLVGLWMWTSWQEAKQSQQQRMAVAAALITAQTQSYFDAVGLHLEELSGEMHKSDVAQHPERILPLLLEFKARHANLGGAALVKPDGTIVSATLAKPGMNLPNMMQTPEWRDDFTAAMQAQGLTVSRPIQAPHLKKWVIPLRYATRDATGKVRYVLQVGIFLENQQALWAGLKLEEGEVLGLLRDDGFLISRLPSGRHDQTYLQRHPSNGMLAAMKQNAPGGQFETIGLDGEKRLGAYQHMQRYPLYAFVTLPESQLRSIWWLEVRFPLLLLMSLPVLAALIYGVQARRYATRMAMIRGKLAEGRGKPDSLPSSGVSEIDSLCLALADSQEKLRLAAQSRERMLLSAANAGTYAVRVRDGVVIAADDAFLQMLEMRPHEVIGKPWRQLLYDDTPLQGGKRHSGRHVRRFNSGSGARPWLSLAEYQDSADGEEVSYGLAIDVSEREWLLTTVGQQSARFQALWQLATNRAKSDEEKTGLMLRLGIDVLDMDAVLIGEDTPDGVVIREAADPLGISPLGSVCQFSKLCELALGMKMTYVVPDLSVLGSMRDTPLVAEGRVRAFASTPIWVGEEIYGTLVFLRQQPFESGFGHEDQVFMDLLAAWFGQMLLQQKQRQVLRDMAMTDSLTGLANRRAAEMRFTEEVARAKRSENGFAIAICDLDRFKLVNDHYGHEVGDEVLQQASLIMRHALREGDWMARWGGEEFILFLHQSDRKDAIVAAERIAQALREKPVQTSQGAIEITASLGIGVFQPSDEDVSRVLAEADGCLYDAKKKGRDCIVASDPTSRTTLWRAGMLQHALRDNRIVPAYQVMVELASGKVVADEALARLAQPEGGIVVAGEFIEAAEGINLIHEVDSVIARQAMKRCLRKLRDGEQEANFAHFINLSPQFLARSELVQVMLAEARKLYTECHMTEGMAKPIVFEITERQLLQDFDSLRRELQPLLDFGFRLALDDFGSGYSSFLYMAELPVSFLKIEGWMVLNMRNNERVLSMVQSLVMLAQRLNITTIAECIEDAETAAMLRDMGVDWGQGYYFGRPECEPMGDDG